MKKVKYYFLLLIVALFLSFAFVPLSAYAETNSDKSQAGKQTEECLCANGKKGTRPATSIIGQGEGSNAGCECGNGEAVKSILNLVIDIMSIGIGILGVIGISITGIQYLTAGGNEEQVRKAKRRLFEIVLGLAAYAAIAVLLRWLIPNFNT